MADRAVVAALMDRLDGLSAAEADWYTALVLCALDECDGDLEAALERADAARFDHPDQYARGAWLWPLQYGWEEVPGKTPPPSALKKSPRAKTWKGTPPDKGYRYQVSPPGSRGKGKASAAPKAPVQPKAPKSPAKAKPAAGPTAAEMQAHLQSLDLASLDDAGMADLTSRLGAMPQTERANLKRALGIRLNAPNSAMGQAILAQARARMAEQPDLREPWNIGRETAAPTPAPAPTDPYRGLHADSAGHLWTGPNRTGKDLGQRPALKAPGDPYAGTPRAADEPKVWDAFRKAEQIERKRFESNEASGIKIPELYDHIKKEIPSLTPEQFHGLLWKWQKEDKLTTQHVNDPHLEPRAAEMPRIPDAEGTAHISGYVDLRDEHALKGTPKAVSREPLPSVGAVTDQQRQSLLRALDAAGGDMAHLSDLARATGMDRDTLHRTMDDLRARGEVTATGDEGRHGQRPGAEWHKPEEGSNIAYLSRKQKAAPKPQPISLKDHATLAAAIQEVGPALPDSIKNQPQNRNDPAGRVSHKVFVSDLYDALKDRLGGASLDDFKAALMSANQAGTILLSHHDMRQINSEKAERSRGQHPLGIKGYETVSIPDQPKARAPAAPATPSHPRAAEAQALKDRGAGRAQV